MAAKLDTMNDDIERVAALLGRHGWRHQDTTGQPCYWSCLQRSTAYRDRHLFTQALERALTQGYLSLSPDARRVSPGSVKPPEGNISRYGLTISERLAMS